MKQAAKPQIDQLQQENIFQSTAHHAFSLCSPRTDHALCWGNRPSRKTTQGPAPAAAAGSHRSRGTQLWVLAQTGALPAAQCGSAALSWPTEAKCVLRGVGVQLAGRCAWGSGKRWSQGPVYTAETCATSFQHSGGPYKNCLGRNEEFSWHFEAFLISMYIWTLHFAECLRFPFSENTSFKTYYPHSSAMICLLQSISIPAERLKDITSVLLRGGCFHGKDSACQKP